MKPLDHSEFDGIAQNYARFKQRFEEMITNSFDSLAQLRVFGESIAKMGKGEDVSHQEDTGAAVEAA